MSSFKHATLSNGLTVVAEIDAAAHTAAAGFFVKTGARDEAPELMGVSHFLEHMMFKGTASRAAVKVNSDFDDLGADHNAFTTSELTAFHVHTLPEHLPAGLDVLADILRPALRQEDFDEEKGVILEEIAMYDDQPFWVLYERAMEAHYGSHPLAHRVLGTAETVKALTRDQMRGYFEHRYSADNTVVSLAGKLDFDAAVRQIERCCGAWPTTNPQRIRPPVPTSKVSVEIDHEKANRHYEIMAIDAPSVDDERRYAAAVLAEILGDADGSKLHWALVDPGLAEEASAHYDGRDADGLLFVSFVCPPEDADEVRTIALDTLRSCAESLVDDDLARARSKIATAVTLAGERPAGRMRRLGQVWTALGRYESLEDDLRRIEALRVADLRRLIRDFPLTPRTIAGLQPKGVVSGGEARR
jgi:predicted Zn-dependent peptidase